MVIRQCENQNFIRNIIIGEEDAYCMNGKVNTRNIREYAPRGNHADYTYEQDYSREKVTVWAAHCGNGTFPGPFFFDKNVDGVRYLNLINHDVVPQMMVEFDHNMYDDNLFGNMWWFQDGAPSHRGRQVQLWPSG
jgi:hypothetical protein